MTSRKKLEILIYPDQRLKQVSAQVEEITDEIITFTEDLIFTMEQSPHTVGLAAPQVGVLARIIVVDISPKEPNSGLIVLVNPQIVASSQNKVVREGCLSIPQYTANIKRAKKITVKGLDLDGKEIEIETTGFEAVALQHEIDHLDGILFLDRIRSAKRDLFKREK